MNSLTLLVVATVGVGVVSARPAADSDGRGRPDWATERVPDTIWILVERATDTRDEEGAKSLLREAEAHARASVEDDPGDIGRRYAFAVVLGLRANTEGGQTKVRAASALHDQLEEILGADPDHVGARHMLGRLHAGVRRMNGVTRWLATNLLGGGALKKATWELAEEHLAFAEQHAPGVADHHLQLARLYSETGRPQLATRELEHVLSIPARTVLELAVLEEAQALLDELRS
ncbi:MAG: hypothetical protein WEB90_08460 [Gemmatimonadota bacterium]